MSSFAESHPDPHSREQRDCDEVAISALVAEYVAARVRRAAAEAHEIRTLSDAAALVDEQRRRLTSVPAAAADLATRSMVAELAAAARISERTVQRQLDEASDLCARFPAVVEALGEGRISRAHVSVIHDAGCGIDDAEIRGRFLETALARAEVMTPGRLRPVVQILAERLHPRTVQERHTAARTRRTVRVADGTDGLCDLILTAEAVLIRGIFDRVTHDAHAVIAVRSGQDNRDGSADSGDACRAAQGDPSSRDERTIDQVRADIVTDLLLTGTPQSCTTGEGIDAIRATVQISVPVLTALGTSDEPALLVGSGPLAPDTARRLAGGAKVWERVLTSPLTGAVITVDRYRPTKAQRRFLSARDERCRFPGCRQPVWRCDIDHTIDAALGGETSIRNLSHLCRRHHVLKHSSSWTVRQLDGGVLEWTSPTGRIYADVPEPVVRFVPEPAPARDDFRDPATWMVRDDGDPPPF